MEAALLVVTNVPDAASAASIARALVEQRLAACVNILPEIRSVYRWQGAIEEAVEVSLLIKTTRPLYAQVEAGIRALHPYDLPEIIALPIEAGLPQYLQWISQEVKKEVNV